MPAERIPDRLKHKFNHTVNYLQGYLYNLFGFFSVVSPETITGPQRFT